MAVTEDEEDQGKESRTRATRCGQCHELVSRWQIRRSGPGSTQQLGPGRAPRRGPASWWQPDSGLREGAVTARGRGCRPVTPTFLLGPRHGHDEGHYQVQRSQEAGGSAPRAPAAASRGLQTGPGSRGSGGGSCGPLPHPCRPGAAALRIWRGPSRRGGGGAGAVFRARAGAPGTRAARGPGLRLREWVWARVYAGVSVSVTTAASTSPARRRGGEAAGQARRAAILEMGTATATGAGLRGAGRGPGHHPAVPGGRRSTVVLTPRTRSARQALAGPRLTGQRSGDSTTPTRSLSPGNRREAARRSRQDL